MRQDSIRWWKTLNPHQRLQVVKEWKQSPGDKHDQQFKDWPENLILVSSSMIEKIYNYITNKNLKNE